MFDNIFEIGYKALLWFSSSANRHRLRGARVEVIAMVACRAPTPSILLGKSPYKDLPDNNIWMPPQEGVNIGETFKDALLRCLEVECGLDLPEEERALDRALYLRSIRYVGSVELPKERHSERLVADNALGTPLESVKLKRKAYWLATVILGSQEQIEPKANGRELLDFKWYSLSEAHKKIYATNRPEKARLLEKCLELCGRDLHGASVNSRVVQVDIEAHNPAAPADQKAPLSGR